MAADNPATNSLSADDPTEKGTPMTEMTPSVPDDMALAHRPVTDVYEPQSPEQGMRLAKWLATSGMLGAAIKTPEQAFTIMIAGKELGVRSMQALRSIHVIEGKPTLSADLMLALCLRAPECKFFRMVESTPEVATYETLRVGNPEPTQYSFTIAMARAAELAGKQNWRRYPDAMLRARCITALARMVYPDLFMGVYDPDELAGPSGRSADFPVPPVVRVVEEPEPVAAAIAEPARTPRVTIHVPKPDVAPTNGNRKASGVYAWAAEAGVDLGSCDESGCGGRLFAKQHTFKGGRNAGTTATIVKCSEEKWADGSRGTCDRQPDWQPNWDYYHERLTRFEAANSATAGA